MSEMELSLMRQRLTEARKLKAQRGELFGRIVAGYCRPAYEDRIEKDSDLERIPVMLHSRHERRS